MRSERRLLTGLLLLSLLFAWPSLAGAQPPLVSEVKLALPAGVEEEELLPLIVVETGKPASRRQIRRTIQLLFETGRFANVTAQRHTLEDGSLRLVFRLDEKRAIRSLQVLGADRLGDSMARLAVGFQVGTEYTEDLLDRATVGLSEAFARIGYEEARIVPTVTRERGGVRVRIEVEEGMPTRLASLRFPGDPGDAAITAQAFPLHEGDVLDRELLETGLQRLRARYRSEGYYRAQIAQPVIRQVGERRVEVEIRVQAGPRISFAFQGNRVFGNDRLRDVLAYQGEEILDAAMVEDLAGRVLRAYRRSGYLDARVVTAEHASADGQRARLTFHVEEGLPLVVRSIDLKSEGAVGHSVLRAWLDEELAAAHPEPALVQSPTRGETDAAFGDDRVRSRPRLQPRQIFDEEIYEHAIDGLLARFRDEGFLEAQIDGPSLVTDERQRLGQVELRVREGRRTRVRAIELVGADALEGMAPLRTLRVGAPLSERLVEQQRIELQSLYGSKGYLYATVRSQVIRPEDNPWSATVRFHVEEGPLVRVGRILSQGNNRTRDWVVRQTLDFKEGDVLGSDVIASSQQELMRLGLFRAAAVRPIDPDLPEEVKDIVVEVRERPGRSLEVGGGVSIADGPRTFGEFTERNILGRNLQFNLRGRVNYQVFREDVRVMDFEDGLERFIDAGLIFPRIWGLEMPVGWRLDLIHERDIRLAYHLTRNAAITGFDLRFSRILHGSLYFDLESHQIEHSQRFDDLFGTLSRTDFDRLRFPRGTTLLGSVRPGLVLDLRDSVTFPRSGLLAKLETDYARSLGGETLVDFMKVSGTLTGYIPLWRQTTLVLSGGGGRVFPLQERSITLPSKRFFLGGAGSVRGFSEDGLVPEDRRAALRQEIADCKALFFRSGCTTQARFLEAGRAVPSEGGDLFVLGRAELRFPIRGALMGGLFLDAGNLWIDPANVDFSLLRTAAGFGLRYATPVGPLALDLGANLDPDPTINEERMAIHFSIGLF